MSRHAYVATTLVFVPSFGDLFLIRAVPLRHRIFLRGGVFVPSFGDLFLMRVRTAGKAELEWLVFVPSFGDLFLIRGAFGGCAKCAYFVFVPSFGDLFLIGMKKETYIRLNRMSFSSPLLGICF